MTSSLQLRERSSSDEVVKLLACKARDHGFDSQSRRYNFRDKLSPASKSRNACDIANATFILKTANQPNEEKKCLQRLLNIKQYKILCTLTIDVMGIRKTLRLLPLCRVGILLFNTPSAKEEISVTLS